MEVLILDNSDIMKYQDLVNTFGLMAKCTKENGKTTKCMAEALLFGETENATKDNLSSIREKGTVRSSGRMVVFMKDSGKMVSNMELEYSRQRTIKLRKENGKMVKR